MLDGFEISISRMKSFFESFKRGEKMTPEEREAEEENYLKWKKIEPFQKRLSHASSNRKDLEPNCFGTAFYLMGILPYDQVIFTSDNDRRVRKALSLMDKHKTPVPNSIMISFDEKKELVHASYIKNIDPLLGYQREGNQGSLEEITDIENNVTKGYLIPVVGRGKYKHLFYTLNGTSMQEWAKEITAEYSPLWYA